MRRGSTKKNPVERRKKPRAKASATAKLVSLSDRRTQAKGHHEGCQQCAKDLSGTDRALFVEEEIGRIFCSEACIASFFSTEIERLEKEFLRRLTPTDLSGEERESLAHLRWITLQEPDEVWREKTLSGDYRYTMISEFQPGNRLVWSICVCLFLRGEPSFLYIAFPTANAAMVNAYRKGERVQWEKPRTAANAKARRRVKDEGGLPTEIPQEFSESSETAHASAEAGGEPLSDRLANAWTEDETFLAQVNLERRSDDIRPDEFELFQSCLEETLEVPDEVWSLEMTDPAGVHLYHFIRHYPDESPGHWYLIVARETDDEEQIEILDAFPTRDAALVDRYRRGNQETGPGELGERSSSRVVH